MKRSDAPTETSAPDTTKAAPSDESTATDVCFWCLTEEKHQQAIAAIKVKPHVSYMPCPACKEIFDKGIPLFEAEPEPVYPNQHSVIEGRVFPTQRYWVVSEDFIRKVFKPEYADEVIKKGRAFINKQSFSFLVPTTPPDTVKH